MTGPQSVSFVVPVRDGAAYLGECLESIVAQTVPPLEVVVVDDGSQDESAAIAGAFGSPVRCLGQAPTGPAAARNHGVLATTGDLVAFLDADDLAAPDRLARQLERFEQDPHLELCDGWAQNFWSPEVPPHERQVAPQEVHTHGGAPKPGLIITWLVRRRLFQVIGGFDETLSIGEDSEWRDRVALAGVPTATVDAVVALRRLHPGNLTRTRYDDYLREVVRSSRRRMLRARGDRRGA